jgi:uroporphyrinogen-III synthase
LSVSRIVARGPKAAGAVAQAGLAVDEVESSETVDGVVAQLLARGVDGLVVAIQLYGAAMPRIIAMLEAAGARVVPVPVYYWTLPEDLDAAKRLIKACLESRLDAVTFTSPPAFDHLMTIARGDGLADELLVAMNRNLVCACVGPVTAAAAKRQGVHSPVWPERGRMGLMVRCLSEVLHTRHRHLPEMGEVVIQGCSVQSHGEKVTLTRRETAVLNVLARRPGAVVARQALLREVWGGKRSPHVVEITIGRLRQRLEPVGLSILAMPRRGYHLEWVTTLSA